MFIKYLGGEISKRKKSWAQILRVFFICFPFQFEQFYCDAVKVFVFVPQPSKRKGCVRYSGVEDGDGAGKSNVGGRRRSAAASGYRHDRNMLPGSALAQQLPSGSQLGLRLLRTLPFLRLDLQQRAAPHALRSPPRHLSTLVSKYKTLISSLFGFVDCRLSNFLLFRKMTGTEYMLSEVMEPHLFVIRKQKRDSPDKVTPMLAYYVLDGSIYQAPQLCNVFAARIVRSCSIYVTFLHCFQVRQGFFFVWNDLLA